MSSDNILLDDLELTLVHEIATEMTKKILIEIISFLFILLFMYAALNKVLTFEKFTVQVGQSPVLTGLGKIVPQLVIISEILVSAFLFLPRFRLIGFFASLVLMVMFTTYIIIILNFSNHIPCSCGGVLERLSWSQHLIFNFVFLSLALLAVLIEAKRKSEETIKVNNERI